MLKLYNSSMKHEKLNRRSLELHYLIADKIRKEPCLIEEAKATIEKWLNTVSPHSKPYLVEWKKILNSSTEQCLAFMTENSEHADSLRQSSPFAGILTNKERFEFLNKWRSSNEEA